jgi:hypothetical protein
VPERISASPRLSNIGFIRWANSDRGDRRASGERRARGVAIFFCET